MKVTPPPGEADTTGGDNEATRGRAKGQRDGGGNQHATMLPVLQQVHLLYLTPTYS